jgi:hypothetical protein
MYWRMDKSGLSDTSGFPVIQAFWSFQLSGHYSCTVILAFWSFWLSGHSSFLVITAVRSFWLSGHSGFLVIPVSGRFSCTVILAILSSIQSLKTKIKKEKRIEKFDACCLFSKELPINFDRLSGNGNIYILK